ncbi:STE20-related kinase adapter protein alpha-like isoform X3 [Diabrotica undecimpunctata]|uniref:STE20-related kinase adapter protein alpha-like isoform X3 n=1 Tax=Diabrotica undecimpunctata TaxID=50387 RepID=UPI003B63A128
MESKMSVYNANISEYQTISILGQCFDNKAVVQLAKHLPSGVMVAIKKFNVDTIPGDIKLLEREIILTRQLNHPNILPYITTFVSGPEVCVVSPLMAYGSCRDLLTRHFNEGLLETAIILIIKDVLSALVYIHKKGYIHRAIRASHILVSVTGQIYLTGMRYACPIVKNGRWQRTIHSFPRSIEKNLNWLSPELLEQNLQDTEISSSILNRRFSPNLHQFVSLCFMWDVTDRPSAAQLLNHPIFKTVKRALPLPELLKPALPLSDRVGYDTDEIENFDTINKLAQLDFYTCDWDF